MEEGAKVATQLPVEAELAALRDRLRQLARHALYWRDAVALLEAADELEQLEQACQPKTD